MFSGIIAAIGTIVSVEPSSGGVRLAVDAGGLDLDDVALGDSIACNGVCLTVTEKTTRGFVVDVSNESLRCTVGLGAPGPINLEKALRLTDRLGGHLVSGHVDGVGEVTRFDRLGEGADSNRLLEIRAPEELARYIARKGSITVNGVSLTTNTVSGSLFTINLIPHTLSATSLGSLKPGHKINLEVDLIARYCERLLAKGDA